VEVRSRVGLRSVVPRALRHAHDAAIASSEAKAPRADFVRTARRLGIVSWQSCTVMAPDCVTADAFTKWGLQAAQDSPRLRRALRIHGAQLWRS
jgi:thiamine biosynthesis lipoprotein